MFKLRSIKSRRLPTSRRPRVENLELRCLLAGDVLPTGPEQYMLELINRARMNPAAEVARNASVADINQGLPAGTISLIPKQPLAFNRFLLKSAEVHSAWMLENDLFQHEGPNNNHPWDRMAAAGYSLEGSWGAGENIAYRSSSATPTQAVTGLIHDDLFTSPGHRTNILGADYREIGLDVQTGLFGSFTVTMATQNFAFSGSLHFITGVVFNDRIIDDDFYSVGEGVGGIQVQATRLSDGQVFTTTTYASGGYQIPVANGVYDVTFSGVGIVPFTKQAVVINRANAKVDLIPTLGSVEQSITLTLAANSIAENGGATTATVTRNTVTAEAFTVSLFSSNATAATVPTSVIIPAGANSTTFTVTAVDDSIADGTQSATITASAAGFTSGAALITVTDDDVATLSLVLAASSISENAGTTTATVTRNSLTTTDLVVQLSSSDITVAMVPKAITIPAGAASATFTVTAIDNSFFNEAATTNIAVSAPGFVNSPRRLEVVNDDACGPWCNRLNPFDVSFDGSVSPIDALIVINEINSTGARALPTPQAETTAPPPFVDVSGDGFLSPLDALLVINELNLRLNGEEESAPVGGRTDQSPEGFAWMDDLFADVRKQRMANRS